MKQFKSLFLLIILLAHAGSAGALTIKIGCVAPEASPWGEALQLLGARWRAISNGTIVVKPYLGGIAGDEADMIRKMRIGQLQGAAVTIMGLKDIYRDVTALSAPLLLRDEEELEFVLGRMRSRFDPEMEKKGFKVLEWTWTGWVTLFSRKPVIYPDDLRCQRLAMTADDGAIIDTWRAGGFTISAINTTDLSIGLESGMVDAFYTTPIAAAVYQWFGIARQMCPLKLCPLFGGLVLQKRVWDQIPDKLKPELLGAVDEVFGILFRKAADLEQKAVALMQEHGLVVHPLPEDAEERWRSEITASVEKTAGMSFSRETYETIKGILSEYRTGRRR